MHRCMRQPHLIVPSPSMGEGQDGGDCVVPSPLMGEGQDGGDCVVPSPLMGEGQDGGDCVGVTAWPIRSRPWPCHVERSRNISRGTLAGQGARQSWGLLVRRSCGGRNLAPWGADPLSLQGERARVRVLRGGVDGLCKGPLRGEGQGEGEPGAPRRASLLAPLSRWRERAGVRVGGAKGMRRSYAKVPL